MDWRDKAHRLIGNMCRVSYLRVNTKKGGGLYKKHRAYSVPEAAEELIDCLGREDEAGAKALFLFSYDCQRATRDVAIVKH